MCAAAGGEGRCNPRIVDRHATLWSMRTARTHRQWEFTTPSVQVTAHDKGVTQVRFSGGQYNRFCRQGGIEVLERARFSQSKGPRVRREALELVGAAVCSSARMDVILMTDPMTLQIHESIGHPLKQSAQLLIEGGWRLRPLGGSLLQARARARLT